MKHLFLIVCFTTSLLFGQTEFETKSLKFVEALKSGNNDVAASLFSNKMSSQIPDNALSQIWDQLIGQNGKLKEFAFNCFEEEDTLTVTYTTLTFKKNTIDAKLVFNQTKKIEGFFLVPVHNCSTGKGISQFTSKPPEYDNPELYEAEEFVLKNDGYAMPGTVLLPKEKEKDVVVIFVHGSGPNDRDETLGPNKPFRDLAVGLAINGIASVRYDKRTFSNKIRQSEMNKMTVYEEVLDDVNAAIDWIGDQKKLKDKKIVILGHSLGAMLIPEIGVNNEKIDGLIMMAAPSGNFEDLLLYQYNYLFELDGKMTKKEKAQVKKLEEQVENVKNNLTDSTKRSDLPLNLHAKYWMSIRDFNQNELAKKSKVPLLILNGERDYQVPMEQFELWKETLSGKENVTFSSFPKLNHLFFEGEGKPSPEEYSKISHVPDYVIEQLTSWLKEL